MENPNNKGVGQMEKNKINGDPPPAAAVDATCTLSVQDQKNPTVAMSRMEKLITSTFIWFCAFTVGLSFNFLNASLLDLSAELQMPVSIISNAFTVLLISFFGGTLACGVLFDHVNRQLASSLLLAAMGTSLILIPIAPSVILLFLLAGILGFSAGGFDCAQIVWMIEIWESQAAPYIQVLCFSFALGSFVSPLLVKPFLTTTGLAGEDYDGNHESEFSNVSLTNRNDTHSAVAVPDEKLSYHNQYLYIPFLVGGFIVFFGSALILFSYWFKKYEKPKPQQESSNSDESKQNHPGKSTRNIIIIIMSALVLGTYQGTEICTMEFLPAFTHFIDLHLGGPDGALVLSSLTGAFTLGRGLGIFIVFKLAPEILLLLNFALIVAGNVSLHLLANNSLEWLWAGSILLGFGFSTLFPSFYGFIEKHLKISNIVGAIMLASGGLISGCYPFIIGYYIEGNPLVLIYTNYFSLAICCGAFAIIYVLTSCKMGFDDRKEGKQTQN